MDGTQGYSGSYPPKFSRVRRQVETEVKYVPTITAYQWVGSMEDRKRNSGVKDERAFKLFEEYKAYLDQQRAEWKEGAARSSPAAK
jgi:hypothetical protein